MNRATIAIVVAAVVLAGPLAATSSGETSATSADQVTLRIKMGKGPWVAPRISVKLRKLVLMRFTVCGVYNHAADQKFNCAPGTNQLPSGTQLRLEENPVWHSSTPATKNPGALNKPGWGTVGVGDHGFVEAILSNMVSNDKFGTVSFRATVRTTSGNVLATSNVVKLVWHK
jgi:hypothetical protein